MQDSHFVNGDSGAHFVIGAARILISGEDGWDDLGEVLTADIQTLDELTSDPSRIKRVVITVVVDVPLTNELPLALWLSWGQPEQEISGPPW